MAATSRTFQWPTQRMLVWLTLAGVLLMPIVAKPFTNEFTWTAFDFAAASVLLLVAGIGYEVAKRMKGTRAVRIAVGGTIFAGVLLIWADRAVGVF